MVRESILRYPIFKLLASSDLDRWIANGRELEFAAGETIFQEGSYGAWAYLLLAGKVRVLRHDDQQREVTAGMIGPSELFGEYALVRPYRNTATCRATTASRLLRLPLFVLRDRIEPLLGEQSPLKNWLRLHALARHLRGQSFLGFISAPSGLKYLDALQTAKFLPGHSIQAEGLGADRWYFIHEGQVDLEPTEGESGLALRSLEAGACFGERGLLGLGRLPLATAVTAVRCSYLTRDQFAPAPQAESHLIQSYLPAKNSESAFTWIGQQEPVDCGIAALAMIAKTLGKEASIEHIRSLVPLTSEGASLQNLKQAAQAIGLRADAVWVAAAQFPQVALPCIAHLHDGHYVVVYEMSPRGATIGDPATGIVKWSADLFAQTCSGHLLLCGAAAGTSK